MAKERNVGTSAGRKVPIGLEALNVSVLDQEFVDYDRLAIEVKSPALRAFVQMNTFVYLKEMMCNETFTAAKKNEDGSESFCIPVP